MGDAEVRIEAVDAVSAASSEARREIWWVVKDWMEMGWRDILGVWDGFFVVFVHSRMYGGHEVMVVWIP